ncbi:MAG: rhomboid family intramembrane serine protease [Planctomycetaceae bacterium]|nr:rhomboid family intramembrane serine protease [Planctomycetaceae bacterium]
MDLNWLLIWMVGASCLLTVLQRLRSRTARWTQFTPPLVTATSLALACLTIYPIAGYVAGVIWAFLMLFPTIGMTWVSALLSKKRYRIAAVLARMVSLTSPWDGGWNLPKLVQAVRELERENYEQALSLLEQIGHLQTSIGRMAMIMRTRRVGNWLEFLEFAESWIAGHPPAADPLMLDAYLQALGETGHRPRLLAEFARLVRRRESEFPPFFLNVIRAKVAAFSGDVDLADHLLNVTLASFDQEFREYWLATAWLAAGNIEQANEFWSRLESSSDSRMRDAVRRRQVDGVLSITENPLSPQEEILLEEIAHLKLAETDYAIIEGQPRGRFWVTWGIAALLLVAFLFEIPGGTTNLDNLVKLGGMVIPVEVTPGQWWRVFAAGFLHYGVLHLLFNVGALLLLGRRLEKVWGPVNLLFGYCLAAFGSIALAPLLMQDATPYEPVVLVGASGGVMGILGGLIAHAGFGIWVSRSRVVIHEFQVLVSVVIVSFVFDSLTPNVSTLCHFLGLVIGLLYGILPGLLIIRQRSKRHARN